MGRKTFESIGRPLPKRTNIVLSRTPYEHEGVIWKIVLKVRSNFVKEFDEIMLIGGGELFKQYLPKADKLYLTQIQADIDGDTSSLKLIGLNGTSSLRNITKQMRIIPMIVVF